MQTIYTTTTHFIRHQGNLVDLDEFRRKLSLAWEGSLAPQLEERPRPAAEPPALTVLPAAPRRRRSRRARLSWALDAGASLGVILMTVSFALQVLA